MAAAEKGSGRLVAISGEAGVGKTRLLAEFLERASKGGRVEVLEGHCYDEDPAVPYGPVIEALRGWIRRGGIARIADAAGVWTGDLARLLPELGGTQPVVAESEAAAQKHRVFEAMYRVLRPGASQAPRLLIVEDLHWSDQTSQELLRSLARAIENDRVLILGTYRSDELHRRHPLTHWLAQLTRERLMSEVALAPLTREEVTRMLDGILGRAAPHGLAATLFDRTGGNPFFVEEILKSLIESGDMKALIQSAPQGRSLDHLHIPLTVRDSVVGRTAGLDETTAQVLKYAAVIGRVFDFELLLALTGLKEEQLLKAIGDLVERQLVAEVRHGGEDRYEFRHALTREAIYEDLLGREQRRIHLEVLNAIERAGSGNGDGRVDQLAYHSLKARELDKAATYAALAGERAEKIYAYREAVAHYEVALELKEGGSLREKAELLDRLGQVSHPLGNSELTLRYWKEARALYEELGDRRRVAITDVQLSRIFWERGLTADAFSHAQAALQGLEEGPPSKELAFAYSTLSQLHMLASHPNEAIRWGEKAIALGEEVGDERAKVHSLNNIGVALMDTGDVERGLTCLEESLAMARRLKLSFDATRACNNMGEQLLRIGDIRRAKEVYEEGLKTAEEGGWDLSRGFILGNLGAILTLLGQWEQAAEVLDRAIRAGEAGFPVALLVAKPQMAKLLLFRGDTLGAIALLEDVRPAVERSDEFQQLRDLYPVMAMAYLESGRREEARQVVDRFLILWRQIGSLHSSIIAMGEIGEAVLGLGGLEMTREVVAGLAKVDGLFSTLWSRTWRAETEGLLAQAEGGHVLAVERYELAVEGWSRMGMVLHEARSRARLADSLMAASGDRPRAERELGRAEERMAALGAAPDLVRLEIIRDRWKLTVAKAEEVTDPFVSLTPREHEVLTLLARGMTNREIARELVISAKTAEIHVGNILGKLDLKSRAQAAALAMGQGLADTAGSQSASP